VNISSNAIGMSVDGLSHYMASKMGVIGFVRGLANDVGPYGITVNAILPAITNTPGNRGVSDEDKKVFWQLQAIKRLAEPEDIVGPRRVPHQRRCAVRDGSSSGRRWRDYTSFLISTFVSDARADRHGTLRYGGMAAVGFHRWSIQQGYLRNATATPTVRGCAKNFICEAAWIVLEG